jgi:hypothetical protein
VRFELCTFIARLITILDLIDLPVLVIDLDGFVVFGAAMSLKHQSVNRRKYQQPSDEGRHLALTK